MNSKSQAGQDLFAFVMTDCKTDGYYLDIGCNHESFHSNTYALEQLGWDGLLVDIAGGCESRKGKFIRCDAANPSELLRSAYRQLPPVVDYLSLDADDATIPAMLALPWNRVTFRVITAEHDKYRVGGQNQSQTQELLQSIGYHRVCADVIIPGYGVAEDWWCYPELINPELIARYQCSGKEWQEILK